MRGASAAALLALALGLCTAPGALAAAPSVGAISPNNGPTAGSAAVVISGSGFTAGSKVSFGAKPARAVVIESPSELRASSPAGGGTVDISVSNASGTSAIVPADQYAYDPPPSGPWLGLNGNSAGTYLGRIDDFTSKFIAYDRGGPIEWQAGEPLRIGGHMTEGAYGLAASLGAGMIPVMTIEYAGYHGHFGDHSLPQGAQIATYVDGFVSSVKEIIDSYPHKRILFEAINEPWGYTTPLYNGAEYANLIAALLPRARAAGIPLNRIYVAAFGANQVLGSGGEPTLSGAWIAAMYRAQPQLQREIQAWYFHPYGPPDSSSFEHSRGIISVPQVQREMTSGQNNIIISEVGYCASDVNHGEACETDEDSAQAARHLSEALRNAVPYREAGWLRALIPYARNAGGWAMQLPGGRLTREGEALVRFARRYGLISRRDPPATLSGWAPLSAGAEPDSRGALECSASGAQTLFCAALLSPDQY